MSAYTGRDVFVRYAIGLENADPSSLTFKDLGMMRTKEFNIKWDTADPTADKSPDFTRTKLVTFKDVEFSGDCVSYTDAIHNQGELEAHVFSPSAATNNQPKTWFEVTFATVLLLRMSSPCGLAVPSPADMSKSPRWTITPCAIRIIISPVIAMLISSTLCCSS